MMYELAKSNYCILIADSSKFLVLLKHKQHHVGGQKSYSITRNHSTILVAEGFSSFSQLSCSPNNMPKWTPSSSLTPTRMYIHLYPCHRAPINNKDTTGYWVRHMRNDLCLYLMKRKIAQTQYRFYSPKPAMLPEQSWPPL